jgi:hypothetical protein
MLNASRGLCSNERVQLFDALQRSDPSPAAEGEDSFAFLNRVDTPFWTEVRRVLDEWFSRYPADDGAELRERFRSKLAGQHWGAWWELYLYELFTKLGFDIDIHPKLHDSTTNPDFKLSRNGSQLYLEAAVVFSGLTGDDDSQASPWLLDAMNDVHNGNFFVRVVEVEHKGTNRLKNREIAEPLQTWLDGLDPDDVIREHESGEDFSRRR